MGARIWFVAAGLLVVLAACEPVSAPTSTTTDLLRPPDLNGSSTSSVLPPETPTTLEPPRFTYQGVLPDGTGFSATIRSQREETLTLVTGTFNRMNGESVGNVRYTRVTETVDLGYVDGVLRLWAAPWMVEVFFDERTRKALALMPEVDVERVVDLVVVGGLPQLRLSGPFTWANAQPQIRYESFVVASGCWVEAARCTDNGAVQVLSSDAVFVGGPGLSQERIDGMTLDTSSSRPVFDPHYLDPGPLTKRNSAAVIWTGEEMIVWGGKQDRDGVPNLVDGAAFNPETNQWRTISPIPLDRPTEARAVWADGEMVVVSTGGTFGYNPKSDRWRLIGDGIVPPEFHDRMLYFEGSVYVWDRSTQMYVMDLALGQWERLPAHPVSSTDPYSGVLRGVGGEVIAATLADGLCAGRQLWLQAADSWLPLSSASLATLSNADCSMANQSASLGDVLFIWDDRNHLAMRYEAIDNEWRDLPPIPLDGTEGASGPVAIDDDHFMVPRWGEGALFSANNGDWTHIDLPGSGTDAEIIWTGKEFLAWGIYEGFDAWRWTPPEGSAGGADTS